EDPSRSWRHGLARGCRACAHVAAARHPHWQADQEFTSLPRPVAAGADRAAVHLDQAAHDREPDTQSDLVIARRLELRKQIENMRELIRRDADAVIAHPDLHFRTPLLRTQGNPAAAPGVLSGVAQYVADCLSEAQRVAMHPECAVGNLGA